MIADSPFFTHLHIYTERSYTGQWHKATPIGTEFARIPVH